MARTTLTSQVATLTEQITMLTGLVTPLIQGQPSTPTLVAEAVAEVTEVEAPAVPKQRKAKAALVVAPEPVKTPSDILLDAVQAKGLAFARGGRTVLTTEHLTAAVRVLKTGTPEILPVKNTRLEKRNITHIAIGRDGKSVITQYVYSPDSE